MEVVLLRGAEEDLWSAWVKYEEIQSGLGEAFEGEVRSGLAQIAAYPKSAPVYAGQFRRLLVRRFEHGIFYRLHGQRDRDHRHTRPPTIHGNDQTPIEMITKWGRKSRGFSLTANNWHHSGVCG